MTVSDYSAHQSSSCEHCPLTDAMLSELRSIRTRLGLISFQLGIAVVALGAIAGLLLGSVR